VAHLSELANFVEARWLRGENITHPGRNMEKNLDRRTNQQTAHDVLEIKYRSLVSEALKELQKDLQMAMKDDSDVVFEILERLIRTTNSLSDITDRPSS